MPIHHGFMDTTYSHLSSRFALELLLRVFIHLQVGNVRHIYVHAYLPRNACEKLKIEKTDIKIVRDRAEEGDGQSWTTTPLNVTTA